MDSFLIPWTTGKGNIIVTNNGGDVLISSDTTNDGVQRSQIIIFRTIVGSVTKELIVIQKGNRVILRDNSGAILRDNVQKVLTAKK